MIFVQLLQNNGSDSHDNVSSLKTGVKMHKAAANVIISFPKKLIWKQIWIWTLNILCGTRNMPCNCSIMRKTDIQLVKLLSINSPLRKRWPM